MSAPAPRTPKQSPRILISCLLTSLLRVRDIISEYSEKCKTRTEKKGIFNYAYIAYRGKYSLWAKTSVEKENHNIIPTCLLGGPRNSSFTRCSRTQTTAPMNTKNAPVVNQRSAVRGFMKIHAFFLSSYLIGTIITTPDSVNGNVKSTYLERFATMVTSPTTASNF